jgi:hypothetical protein
MGGRYATAHKPASVRGHETTPAAFDPPRNAKDARAALSPGSGPQSLEPAKPSLCEGLACGGPRSAEGRRCDLVKAYQRAALQASVALSQPNDPQGGRITRAPALGTTSPWR